MTKRRLLFLTACLIFTCIAVFILVRINARKDRITWKNIERIQIGMAESEVEAIFGVPAGNYNATESFTPDENDPQRCWIGDGPGVILRFDADGKVAEIHLLAVPKEMNLRRTVVGTARRWTDGLFDKLAD